MTMGQGYCEDSLYIITDHSGPSWTLSNVFKQTHSKLQPAQVDPNCLKRTLFANKIPIIITSHSSAHNHGK